MQRHAATNERRKAKDMEKSCLLVMQQVSYLELYMQIQAGQQLLK
tara:strand:+ start:221 stop:355 length:135 start_codon:yes stop_codon:yes gene_type:complete